MAVSLPRVRMIEHRRWQENSRHGELFRKSRTDSGGHELAQYFPALADSALPVEEDVLHGDHVAFHAADLGDVDDPAFSVAETRNLNDQVNRRSDLTANGAVRNIQAGHGHHGFEA